MTSDQSALPLDLEAPKPGRGYISFSQVSTYSSCGEKYRLRYYEKVPQEPSGPAIAGSAVHSTIELAETNRWWADAANNDFMADAFFVLFGDAVEKAGGEEAIRWGGRKSREFPEGENVAWWHKMAPSMLKRYGAIRRQDSENGYQLREGGSELAVNVMLPRQDDEPLLVRGYIDCVLLGDDHGRVMLRDWKTGWWSEPLQLAVYAWMLAQLPEPIHSETGEMAKLRAGELAKVIESFDLRPWVPLVPKMILDAQQGMDAGLFIMRPSNFCKSCSVRAHCAWGKTLESE